MGKPGCLGRSWEVLGSWARSLTLCLACLAVLEGSWRTLGTLGTLGLFHAKLAKQIWEELATTRVF